jgi:glycosyltransferase involved in cell wall biosynthesis
MHHVHTEQWRLRFGRPVAALGRLAEGRLMPFLYHKTLFVSVSPSTRASLIGLGVDAARIRVVPNGVDFPSKPSNRSSDPLFVAVGRFVGHKRFELLLKLWPRVRCRTGGQLVLIGDGPDRRRLEALAGEGVTFAGKVSDAEKWEWLSQAWLLVHPALHEGWGMVIAEAGAAGTPAVGFRVPGVRDVIVDGYNGALVDTEDELVARWVELAVDDEQRRCLEVGASKRATEFSWPAAVDRFAAVVQEAVA